MNRTARSVEELFPVIGYARAGDLKAVKEWIEAGSPLNLPPGKKTRRQSPLQIAIEQGFLTLVEMLLDGGAERLTRRFRSASLDVQHRTGNSLPGISWNLRADATWPSVYREAVGLKPNVPLPLSPDSHALWDLVDSGQLGQEWHRTSAIARRINSAHGLAVLCGELAQRANRSVALECRAEVYRSFPRIDTNSQSLAESIISLLKTVRFPSCLRLRYDLQDHVEPWWIPSLPSRFRAAWSDRSGA